MKRVFQAGTKRSGRMAGAFGSRASASGHRSVWTFLFLLLFMFLSLLPVPGCGSREEAASGSRSLESRGADASALPEKADSSRVEPYEGSEAFSGATWAGTEASRAVKGEPAGKIDLEQLCRAMGFERVRVVDPYDLKATDQAVKEELAAREPSVIISRRPCALLKYVKHQAPLAVDTDKCVGCKSCMRIGCPAISMKEGKAHVDNTLCVGCGVCEQMCAFGAFQSTEKEG